MMKDVIIKIDQNSMVYKQETVLGISYENLQGKIIFKFLGTFPKGTAYLEYERGTEKGYLQMNQVGEEYQLEIKSSLLTKEGRIYLQLRVTEDTTPEGIPVFKSNKFYLEVKEAINATAEIPDEYPEWIDTANEKIKEMDNLNITTERVEDGVDIVLTNKKGVTTRTEVKDGAPGPQGPQGEPGAVKMQVVDILPETGETDTIYLVKKNNPGEQNLYDEYVYANGAWEHIGDTSVDLTDYYTKEESDENLNARIPVFNLPISDVAVNFTSGEPVENASAIINFLYSLGDFTGHAIVHNNYNPDYARFQDVLATIEGINKQRSEYVFKGVYNIGANYTTELYGVNINIYGTWTNNVFTANRVQVIKSNDTIKPITISNHMDDTTTDPVEGKVIKKYVDDNILLSKDKCFYFLEAGVRYDMTSIITDTDTLDKLSQIMTDYYPKYLANNNLCCVIFGKDDTGASNGCFVTLQGRGTKFYYTYPYRPGYSRRYGYIGYLDIAGTWNNSTQKYTANNNSAIRIISYTPTTDDNPATKKYVDDQITTVNDKTLYLEGTGLIFGSGLSTAENKQLLTDTINKNIGSYFNVIVRDSDSVLTWTYSFDTLPQTTSSYIRTLAPYYSMTVARTTVYIGEMQINYTYDADKGLYNITQWTMADRRQLSITDQNEYISGTKTFTTLPKTTLVPTTDDQFVNKKYVDDQVGNINTILATLTTVSEVSK